MVVEGVGWVVAGRTLCGEFGCVVDWFLLLLCVWFVQDIPSCWVLLDKLLLWDCTVGTDL